MYLLPLWISSPSFDHVTVGVGTPLVGHWIVMLVLVSAVTLSPMVKVMGLWSLPSTVCGTSEVIMDGLTGSVEKIKNCWR